MPIRVDLTLEADRRARREIARVIESLRNARTSAGLGQSAVARAVGISQQSFSAWERGAVHPSPVLWVRWGAVVGIDVRIQAFAAGSPLRDAGQLRLISRAVQLIGSTGGWTWSSEVPVSSDPDNRRAFDAVLRKGGVRIGLEALTRLVDAQAQVRAITLKQEAARLACLVVVLADTRHNRVAAVEAAPALRLAFPLGPRAVLAALRAGELPAANGFFFA